MHARHLIRLRRRVETVQLRDAIPEIVFLNSHDGTSAYQLRVGLFRVVCTNGLIVSASVFPVWRVEAGSHEEAMAIYNIRRGFGPYEPLGEAAPCPRCGAAYYPEGSAQCWNCDHEG